MVQQSSRILVWFIAAAFVVASCSSKNEQSGGKAVAPKTSGPTKPAPRLDPPSATLFPAPKDAKARDFRVTTLNRNRFQHKEFKDDGLVIFGVSLDKQGGSIRAPLYGKI